MKTNRWTVKFAR